MEAGMNRLCIFLLPLLLVGCYAPNANAPKPAASSEMAVASLQPGDMSRSSYEAPIASYIKRYFVHADSLRAVKIGEPFSGKLHGLAGSIVCAEMDAKNTTGSYTGPKRTAFLVKDETVIESDYDTPLCKDQQLVAWPEMDVGSGSRAGRRGNAPGNVARQQQGMK
jgi:hypothetical protein